MHTETIGSKVPRRYYLTITTRGREGNWGLKQVDFNTWAGSIWDQTQTTNQQDDLLPSELHVTCIVGRAVFLYMTCFSYEWLPSDTSEYWKLHSSVWRLLFFCASQFSTIHMPNSGNTGPDFFYNLKILLASPHNRKSILMTGFATCSSLVDCIVPPTLA